MTEDDKNNGNPKATLTLLEIPDALKLRGIRGIAYGGSFMSVDYKGQLFPFTVYKGDITKTLNTFDKMIDSQMDQQTKSDVMGLNRFSLDSVCIHNRSDGERSTWWGWQV